MTVSIQDLNDRYEIADALIRFANGMDAADEELIGSAFAKNAVADFTPAATKVGMQFPVLEGLDSIVAALVPFAKAYITSHSVTNTRIERIGGETAELSALVEAQHLPMADPSRHFLMKNQYEIDLVREGKVWKMSKMTIENLWSDGDVTVMTGDE